MATTDLSTEIYTAWEKGMHPSSRVKSVSYFKIEFHTLGYPAKIYPDKQQHR